MEGSGQVPFLLAERAREECARSMRAVKGSLGHSPKVSWRESEDPRLVNERVLMCSGG